MAGRSRHVVRTAAGVALAAVAVVCLLIVLRMVPGGFGPAELAAVIGLGVMATWGAARVRASTRMR